mmetsp:Transcript_15536/g.46904  ORF Transcript_15536/g.46904 Transcript_15536/m.46904 type:complete len:528 (-) Transcript_15536:1062-2645(-)
MGPQDDPRPAQDVPDDAGLVQQLENLWASAQQLQHCGSEPALAANTPALESLRHLSTPSPHSTVGAAPPAGAMDAILAMQVGDADDLSSSARLGAFSVNAEHGQPRGLSISCAPQLKGLTLRPLDQRATARMLDGKQCEALSAFVGSSIPPESGIAHDLPMASAGMHRGSCLQDSSSTDLTLPPRSHASSAGTSRVTSRKAAYTARRLQDQSEAWPARHGSAAACTGPCAPPPDSQEGSSLQANCVADKLRSEAPELHRQSWADVASPATAMPAQYCTAQDSWPGDASGDDHNSQQLRWLPHFWHTRLEQLYCNWASQRFAQASRLGSMLHVLLLLYLVATDRHGAAPAAAIVATGTVVIASCFHWCRHRPGRWDTLAAAAAAGHLAAMLCGVEGRGASPAAGAPSAQALQLRHVQQALLCLDAALVRCPQLLPAQALVVVGAAGVARLLGGRSAGQLAWLLVHNLLLPGFLAIVCEAQLRRDFVHRHWAPPPPHPPSATKQASEPLPQLPPSSQPPCHHPSRSCPC